MINILESLYDGNLSLESVVENRSPEHQKAVKTAYELMDALEKKLNAEETELLDKKHGILKADIMQQNVLSAATVWAH